MAGEVKRGESGRRRGQTTRSRSAATQRRTVTKADLVETIYDRVGFSKKESAELVEAVFEVIKDALVRGEKVKFSGFGNFIVREKSARKGRNPQTGVEIELSARRVLTFKPSLVLKNTLNEGTTDGAHADEDDESEEDEDADEDDGDESSSDAPVRA
jgi:integration host factor subunit alpha